MSDQPPIIETNPQKKRETNGKRKSNLSKNPYSTSNHRTRKLAELEANYKTQDENEAKYQDAYKAWQKELADFAIAHFSKAENIRTNYRSWNKTLNVDFDIVGSDKDFPTEPERDFEQLHRHSYTEQKEEMSNAIRILKMTDEDVVNTSTYNAVARYL